jgi:hypothetical protein
MGYSYKCSECASVHNCSTRGMGNDLIQERAVSFTLIGCFEVVTTIDVRCKNFIPANCGPQGCTGGPIDLDCRLR